MASENPPSPTIDPELYEHWDDEDDLRWKAPLEALMKGTQTPVRAAQIVDNIIRAETSKRLQKLIDYANSHNLTAEQRESGDWGGLPPPNAGPCAEQFFRPYCRMCAAFSPYSEVQNRLIEFLEELGNLPRWMAPESRPDENGNVHHSEFWAFGYNWIGLEDEFRRHHASKSFSLLHHLMNPLFYYRDTATYNRWRNYQHAMARITAGKFVYCAPWSALQDILPPRKPTKKRTHAYDLFGAAQWVTWPNECRYVYHECMKQETTDHYWRPWSKERWSH
ncbi:hypothetical protein CC80DRAFT_425436 [Byssothecium circinans]|uniref:Uncharacterized protein n=1 Tax=Byssothecium circinans TaxID=147558 RepID=A0A6A5TE36_9PLEO|nr:hypothetical protein CC80DRAFT_425436 [Byssothecium circinans]